MLLQRIPRWLLALLVACIPVLVSLILISSILKSNLYAYIPHQENDVVGYWHYIATFSKAGFSGGYYAPNEITAQATVIHFDTHGPGFPVLFGTVAHFTGWQPYSGILFNFALITIGLLVCIYIARLDRIQILVLGALALTFWPLLLFIPTGFQETLHQSAACMVAAVFFRLIVQQGRIPKPLLSVIVLFLLILSVVRLSWALCFFPLFILTIKTKPKRKIMFAAIATFGLTISVLFLLRATAPPGVNTLFDTITAFRVSLRDGIGRLVYYLYINLQSLFIGSPTDVLQNLQIIGLVASAFVALIWVRRSTPLLMNDDPRIAEPLLRIWNLIVIMLTSFIIYLAPGYYRVFSTPLLMTLLLLIAFRKFRLVGIIILTNLLFTGSFLTEYAIWKPNFTRDQVAFTQTNTEVAQYIVYDSAVTNPWCNTLLIDVRLYDSRVVNIPAGIGISYVLDRNHLQFPLKSRYLLFDSPLDLDLYKTLQPQLNVQQIAQLSIGDLYINQDAACS